MPRHAQENRTCASLATAAKCLAASSRRSTATEAPVLTERVADAYGHISGLVQDRQPRKKLSENDILVKSKAGAKGSRQIRKVNSPILRAKAMKQLPRPSQCLVRVRRPALIAQTLLVMLARCPRRTKTRPPARNAPAGLTAKLPCSIFVLIVSWQPAMKSGRAS